MIYPATGSQHAAGRERGDADRLTNRREVTSGQYLETTAIVVPVSPPAQSLEAERKSAPTPLPEPFAEGIGSASTTPGTFNPLSVQDFGFRSRPRTSIGFTDAKQSSGSIRTQAPSLPAAGQGSDSVPSMALTAGATEQSAPSNSPSAADSFASGPTVEEPRSTEVGSWSVNVPSQVAGTGSLSMPPIADMQPVPLGSPVTGSDGSAPMTSANDPGVPELPTWAEISSSQNVSPDSKSRLVGVEVGSGVKDRLVAPSVEHFAPAESSAKVSENEPIVSQAPGVSTKQSAPAAEGALHLGLHTVADSVSVSSVFKAEGVLNISARVSVHTAQAGSRVATEQALGPVNQPASAPPSITSSEAPAAPRPLYAAPQPAEVQTVGTSSTSKFQTPATVDLADSSTSGQAKSGQQSGPKADATLTSGAAPTLTHTATPASELSVNVVAVHPPSVPAVHSNASPPQTFPSSNELPNTLSAWQNYDGGPGKIVRSASLTDSATGAEMHVELRSGTLGPLEVHAVLHEGSVGAEIHVQGQEAHTLLAAGLPSLERALGERNLRVENISVYQDQTGGGMSGGDKQNSHSGSSSSPQRQVTLWDSPPLPGNSETSEGEESANPAAGLSVQA